MYIAKTLLQEFRLELKDEITHLQEFLSYVQSDDARLNTLIDLKMTEEEMAQVDMELRLINEMELNK